VNDELLKKYFDFDEGDLSAKRLGRMTPRQQARRASGEKFVKRLALVAGLVVLLIAVGPSVILWPFGENGPEDHLTFWIIWSLVWIPLGGFFAFKLIRFSGSRPKEARVCKVEGPINLIKEESYSSSMHRTVDEYELHVGGQTFDVESEAGDIMMQGDVYAIYYIEGEQDILSVERLAGG
jgi:hypothetical protein